MHRPTVAAPAGPRTRAVPWSGPWSPAAAGRPAAGRADQARDQWATRVRRERRSGTVLTMTSTQSIPNGKGPRS